MYIRAYSLLIVCVVLTACSTIKATNDYDPGYDFSKLKSYNWIPNPNAKLRSGLMVKHFKKSMEQQFAAKGMTLDESNPDFRIAYHSNVERRVSINNWGYGYSGWYGGGGLDVYQYEEGTAVIDFIDAKTNEMIYRSSLNAEVNRYTDNEKRMKRLEEAVSKILENFPPKIKK